MVVKELTTLDEMLSQLALVQQLYPEMTKKKYEKLLREMIPNQYSQVVVFDKKKPVGLAGIWLNTRLWCGKYLDLDNVIVDKNYRSKGIGKLINNFAEGKAKKLGCKCIVLDAYVENRDAHRFYYRDGYAIRGFHFLKNI